jgi:sodium transport system ATP-binding protein
VVIACGLGKHYGTVRALDGLDLSVAAGEIVGLLGPNGAGKTTALRLLAALIAPGEGTASVAGHDVRRAPVAVKRAVGFLSASTGLYGRLTVRECLDYFGALCGLGDAERARRIGAVAAELGFSELLDRRCDRLSTGQKQRVSVARAVLHEPRALLFDEPTAGLDLFAARVVHEMARKGRAAGQAIVWSTHDLTEAELLCDRMVLLFGGRVRGEGTAAELKATFGVGTLAEVFLAAGADGGAAAA